MTLRNQQALFLVAVVFWGCTLCASRAEDQGSTNKPESAASEGVAGKVRVQFLSPTLVRIEERGRVQGTNDQWVECFEDRPTFTAVERQWPGAEFTRESSGEAVVLKSRLFDVVVPGGGKSLDGIEVKAAGGEPLCRIKTGPNDLQALAQTRFPSPEKLGKVFLVLDHDRMARRTNWNWRVRFSPNKALDFYVFVVAGREHAEVRREFIRLTCGPAQPPADVKLHLFLLAGQSNMADFSEPPEKEDHTAHPRVWTLNKSNEWVPAVAPIHFNNSVQGVGPGFAFGKAIADADPNIHVGLIPCAVGGTGIGDWTKWKTADKGCYFDAVFRAKVAMERGTLKGILWHQGESDALGGEKAIAGYLEKLTTLVANWRADLNAPEVPFIVGEIEQGSYKEKGSDKANGDKMNEILRQVPERISRTGCVSVNDLLSKLGRLTGHYPPPIIRALGKRYAAEYLRLTGTAVPDKKDERNTL